MAFLARTGLCLSSSLIKNTGTTYAIIDPIVSDSYANDIAMLLSSFPNHVEASFVKTTEKNGLDRAAIDWPKISSQNC